MQDNSFITQIQDTKRIKTILYTKQANILTIDKLIQQAAQTDPSNFHVWYAWGIIKKLQDNLLAAEIYLKKALEIDPNSITALHELGRVSTFKKKYLESEKIFLGVLESQSDNLLNINPDILLNIADNYIYWANDEYSKKNYSSWVEITKKAFNTILLAIDLFSSERRIHELHKKICLDYGLRLFEIGEKRKGEKYLRRVIAEIRIQGKKMTTNKETLLRAYFKLAKYEESKKQPNWNLMDIYIRKGLAISNKEKI